MPSPARNWLGCGVGGLPGSQVLVHHWSSAFWLGIVRQRTYCGILGDPLPPHPRVESESSLPTIRLPQGLCGRAHAPVSLGQSRVGNWSPAAAEAVARRWLCGVSKAVLDYTVPAVELRSTVPGRSPESCCPDSWRSQQATALSGYQRACRSHLTLVEGSWSIKPRE